MLMKQAPRPRNTRLPASQELSVLSFVVTASLTRINALLIYNSVISFETFCYLYE